MWEPQVYKLCCSLRWVCVAGGGYVCLCKWVCVSLEVGMCMAGGGCPIYVFLPRIYRYYLKSTKIKFFKNNNSNNRGPLMLLFIIIKI